MDWFLKLEPNVQVALIGAAALVAIVLLTHLRVLLQRPARISYTETTTPENKPDWFVEALREMNKVNTGPFHYAHYTIKTEPKKKPPQADDKLPDLKVTRYYVRRDDGMFFSTNTDRWVPQSRATYWLESGDAHRCAKELYDHGIKNVKVTTDEVEE